MGRFVKDGSVREGEGLGQDPRAPSGFVGEEATKIEGGCVHARAHQRRDGGAGPGQHLDGKTCKARFADQSRARVGNGGRASITDEGHVEATLHALDEVCGTRGLIVLMEAGLGFRDAVVFEEDSGMTCILSRHKVTGMQDLQCPQSDVAKVPDGSWNDREHAILPTFGELRHDLDSGILSGHWDGLALRGLEILT